MKLFTFLFSMLLLISTQQSNAAMITNGDFSSCDFTGWSKDTDGVIDGSTMQDFNLVGTAPNCQAAIRVDYSDTEAFFANTLFQSLDLTATSGNQLVLSFDLAVDSLLDSQQLGFVADYVVVGLNDGLGNLYDQTGQLGTLFETEIDGADNYPLSFNLDASFINQTGWFIDFQVLVGADSSGFTDLAGSTLFVDNVELREVEVPTPPVMSLFLIGLGAFRLASKRTITDGIASADNQGRACR